MSATDTYSNLVQQFYVAYFGRPADPGAVSSFSAALDAANAPATLADLTSAYYSNDTISALIDSFGNSHESATLYGTVSNDLMQATSFITAIYNNLFDRAPALAGLVYWTDALLDGSMSPGNAALTIAAAAAANTSTLGTIDAHTVANKTAVAAMFTADLSDPTDAAAYTGATAAADARVLLDGVDATTVPATYGKAVALVIDTIVNAHPAAPLYATLTSDADTLTATNFFATLSSQAGQSTLGAADTLYGAGAAELYLDSDGSALPAGLAMEHIPTISITSSGDVGNVDVSAYTDVAKLYIESNAVGSGNLSIVKAAASTAITLFDNPDNPGATGADHVVAESVVGQISLQLGQGHAYALATSVDGTVMISSASTTGDTLLSATSMHGQVSISANAAATSGSYDIVASSGAFDGTYIDASGGIGRESYYITLGQHAGSAIVQVAHIGVGAQANAGSYAANTVIGGAQTGDVVWFAPSPSSRYVALGDQTALGTLNQAIAHAHAVSANGAVEGFTYAGNTYLLEDQVGTVAAANSTVVELLGIHTVNYVATTPDNSGQIVALLT